MDFLLLLAYLELQFGDILRLLVQQQLLVLNLTTELLDFLLNLRQLVASNLKFSLRLETHI
jgi:hypothetical protein